MIKVFASADWHEGPEFNRYVAPAVEYFIQQVREQQPDLVLIPGDLFVKRGSLKPEDSYNVRRWVYALAEEAPTVIMPGNHDNTHMATGVDSITGTFLPQPPEMMPALYVITKPGVYPVSLYGGVRREVNILAVPYPTKQIWGAGKDLSPGEMHRRMTELMGEMIRGYARELDPQAPNIFMFHGSVDGGKAGPEVMMTSEHEVVVRQGDLPGEAAVCVGGHLHLPQQVGRFLYTGAPACHTYSEERLDPTFLEVRLFGLGERITLPVDDQDNSPWIDPNAGHETVSRWNAWYMRHPIPVAVPLVTLDYRREDLGDAPMDALRGLIEQNATKIMGSRTRLRFAVPIGQRGSMDADTVERWLLAAGADSPRVMMETRPDIVVRSQEVHTGISFGKGVDLWLQTQPAYESYRDELVALIPEVESRLTPEQRLEMEPVDIRPVSVGWENWKQHGKGSLDFDQLPGLTVVRGENMAGKSNLAELHAFIRWGALRARLASGATPGRSRLEHAIRKGERVMKAWEVFESHGQRYKVERSVQLSASGKSVKGSLLLSVQQSDGSWSSISEGTATETQKTLNKVVGTLDHYLSTSFSAQNDLERILMMGQSDFQDTIQEACNTQVWEHRANILKTILDEGQAEYSKKQGQREQLEGQATSVPTVEAAVAEQQQKVDTLRAEGQAAREAVEAKEAKLKDLQAQADKLKETQDAITAQTEVYQNAHRNYSEGTYKAYLDREQERNAAWNQLDRANRARTEIPPVEARVRQMVALEAEQKNLMESRQKRDEIVKQVRGLEARIKELEQARYRELGAWQKQRSELQGALMAHRTKLDQAIAEWDREKTVAEKKIEAMKRTAGLLGQVENCVPDSIPHPQPTLNTGCILLQDALDAKNQLPGAESDRAALEAEPAPVQQARAKLSEAEGAFQDHERQQPSEDATPEEHSLAAQVETLNQQAESIYDDSAWAKVDAQMAELLQDSPRERLAVLRELVSTVDEKTEAATKADAALERAKADRAQAYEEMKAAEKALNALKAKVQDFDFSKLEDAGRVLSDAKAMVGDVEKRMAAAQEALGGAKARLEAAQQAREALRAVEKEIAALDRHKTVCTTLRNACGRSGIPYLILEQALPLFESVANQYLSDTALQVQVLSQGDDGVERTFSDDNGAYPVSEASGFGRAILGISMRWALAMVAATFSGTKIHSYIFDEGFGSFSEANLIGAQRMLRRMVEEEGVERVTVITHIPAVQEAADQVLWVKVGDDGSIVEGPGTSLGKASE